MVQNNINSLLLRDRHGVSSRQTGPRQDHDEKNDWHPMEVGNQQPTVPNKKQQNKLGTSDQLQDRKPVHGQIGRSRPKKVKEVA
jgi:hypothetical protein